MLTEPGSVTDLADPGNLTLLAKYHKWIAYQLQNGGNDLTEPNIVAARSAGLQPEGWGVTYAPDDSNNNPRKLSFYDQNFILGTRAVSLGVDELQVDIEHAAVNTRGTQDLRVVIKALRDAGWTKPISINTMGAPDSPQTSDYAIDVKSFLDTGGGLYSQDYYNESDTFSPKLGRAYWVDRMGVPPNRFNSMIGLHTSGSDKRKPNLHLSGTIWRELLKDANIGRNHSIFMSQHAIESDLAPLATLALSVGGVPTRTATITKANILNECESQFHVWITQMGMDWTTGKYPINKTAIYRIASILRPDVYKP